LPGRAREYQPSRQALAEFGWTICEKAGEIAGMDTSGAPAGISVDLARAFAAMLRAELELMVFDPAGKSVQAVSEERADFGFSP
jgi:hypothetical protein